MNLSTLILIMDSIPSKITIQYQQERRTCKSNNVVYLWRQCLDNNYNVKPWTKVLYILECKGPISENIEALFCELLL